MKKSINVVARNLRDPRYRPQVVKLTKGNGTYNRKKDKQALNNDRGFDRYFYF